MMPSIGRYSIPSPPCQGKREEFFFCWTRTRSCRIVSRMMGVMVIQGRELSAEVIGLIQGLLAKHLRWGRTRLNE